MAVTTYLNKNKKPYDSRFLDGVLYKIFGILQKYFTLSLIITHLQGLFPKRL